jgi:hypothetical protein
MPRQRRGSRVKRTEERRARVASNATVVGVTGLVMLAIITGSVVLSHYADIYAAGLVLGSGVATTAWVLNARARRIARRPRRAPGVSRTRDCRQARWTGPAKPNGAPHLPTAAQRRVRPCPGSRRY